MPHARFQSQLGSPVIDEVNGVITGCRIATLGAVSMSREGEGAGLVMDAQTITGLLSLSKNESLPAFYSHSWFDDLDTDPLAADTGVWKNARLQDGNLVADWHAFETPYRAGIFSRAKVDPNSIAVSPIFDYEPRNGDTKLCNPTSFISADFVKYGAINKALFNRSKHTARMADITIDDLKQLLSTPEGKAMVQGCIDGHSTAESDAAEMEKAADVTDADKKPEDDQKPAMMRAVIRCGRAFQRRIKSLPTGTGTAVFDEDRFFGKVKTLMGSELTALLGKNPVIQNLSATHTAQNEAKAFIDAQMGAGCKTRAQAVARMARDKPKLYAAFRGLDQTVAA